MNIVLGSSGQVGSHIAKELKRLKQPVTTIVRNQKKNLNLSIPTKIADLFQLDEVINAFKGAKAVFLLTPENPNSDNIFEDTKHIIENYTKAIQETGVKRIVALSCIGAQIHKDTGNILMSQLLEESISDLDAEKIIVRPSYYFSNWLGFVQSAIDTGILTSFLPANFECEMQSPIDVASFIAEKMCNPISDNKKKKIFELAGTKKYSPNEVAKVLTQIVNKRIEVQEIEKKNWEKTLQSFGFTENSALNLSKMTSALVDEVAQIEYPDKLIRLTTTLKTYLKQNIEK